MSPQRFGPFTVHNPMQLTTMPVASLTSSDGSYSQAD